MEAVEDDSESLQVNEVLADISDPTFCFLFGDSSEKSLLHCIIQNDKQLIEV